MTAFLRIVGGLCLCAVPNLLSLTLAAAEPETSRRTYDPVEQTVEGWTIKLDPALLAEEQVAAKALTALANHLQRVKFILPEKKVAALQKLPIWIELQNHSLSAMQYHPDRGWLTRNDQDPRLAKHVHIPVAAHLFERHTWAKHPYVVLHELAHAYHDQVLSFEHPEIIAVFDAAKEAGIYEDVLLFTGKKVRHYALSNHKEYFAESTEAYLGVNDFYPFVRAELNEHDPRMFELLQEIWGEVE